MDAEPGVRRSGRQRTATKLYTPNYNVTRERKKRTDKRKQDDTNDNPIEIPNSNKKTKNKRLGEKGLCDSATKKQRKDVNELHSNKEDQENLGSLSNVVPKARERKSSGVKSKNVPTQPKKTKFEKINDQLNALGVNPDEENGNCARAAIYRGFIKLTGKQSDLDQVIVSDTLECGHKCDATLGDLLEQPDNPGFDYECQEATVFCNADECWGKTYVTRICTGKPTFDGGKFHNHCNECKIFGKCIGDWRNTHCKRCGNHYFEGSAGLFKCECGGDWGGESEDSEESEERGRGMGREDCVLM